MDCEPIFHNQCKYKAIHNLQWSYKVGNRRNTTVTKQLVINNTAPSLEVSKKFYKLTITSFIGKVCLASPCINTTVSIDNAALFGNGKYKQVSLHNLLNSCKITAT